MSLFLPYERATLLVTSGPENDPERKHMFIVLTDPIKLTDSTNKQVLMVPLSSSRPNIPYYDPACILQIGDHPFIKHESFIFYREARIEDANKLLKGVAKGDFLQKDCIDQEVFDRITKGLYQTEHLPPKYLIFYEQSLNV